MAFVGTGPTPTATPMYGAFIPAQASYAMGAAVPYAIMPYGVASVAAPMPGYHTVYDPDASALTQGMEGFSVSPDERMIGGMGNGTQGYAPYPAQQQGGVGHYSGYQYPQARGPRNHHQQQPLHGHITGPNMPMAGHGAPFRGPPGLSPTQCTNGLAEGGRPNGSFSPSPNQQNSKGQPGQLVQPQRRRKVQRGLEDNVKRTVYISYIDQQVTEESLATCFADCGTVMDCRICGDPNSAMRFAFIEFLEEVGAQQALTKTGQTLGTGQLRVLPSKTAIVPVNKELMPRSHEELERCSRTVYVANIDKKVEREDVRNFFEHLCGKVNKIRLLGDLAHSTRIAFIEFIQAESAMAALNCSGALLGSLPLRVSPSKTPVRGDKEDRQHSRGQQRNNKGAAKKPPTAPEGDEQDVAALKKQERVAAAHGDENDTGGRNVTAVVVVTDSIKDEHADAEQQMQEQQEEAQPRLNSSTDAAKPEVAAAASAAGKAGDKQVYAVVVDGCSRVAGSAAGGPAQRDVDEPQQQQH